MRARAHVPGALAVGPAAAPGLARPRPARVAGPAARVSRPGRLRLTRRGRVAVVLTSLLVLSLFLSVGHATFASGPDGPRDRVRVVQPGETLWSIATRLRPHEDPRPFIQQVVELNGLATAGLDAGQRLRIPSP